MKRTQTLGICLLLLLMFLLTGCSKEALLERGSGLLDELFTGDAIVPLPSTEEPDTEEPDIAEPDTAEPVEPDTAQEPDIPASEEPDIPDPDRPAVSGGTEPEEPGASGQTSKPSDTSGSSAEITPSHTDVTFFSAGESFRYQPKGTTGTYACTYASDNEKVAAVDKDTGRVTAVGPGTANVTMHVECNGQYDFSCVVRCNWKGDQPDKKEKPEQKPDKKEDKQPAADDEPPLPPETPASTGTSGVTASHSDATFFHPKEHFTLSAKGAGDDSTISYTTSDSAVASVSQSGVVTAVGPGTATVTMSVDCGGTEYLFDCIVRCSW